MEPNLGRKHNRHMQISRAGEMLVTLGIAGLGLVVSGSAATLRVPLEYPTVQAAMSAAQPGDVVLLSAGRYDEAVTTARSGTAERRIVLDGQGVATLRQFTFQHEFVTVQNLHFFGATQAYSRLVYFGHRGHHAILSNCVLDASAARYVYGIEWRPPRQKPFGTGEVASFCLVISNELKNVVGIPMVSLMGDSNRVIGNFLHDGGDVDFFRLFGRRNVLAYNSCSNNYMVADVANHPDFIQTFGNNGDGSMGHVIAGNRVMGVWGGQLTQLSGDLVPEIRDWTFCNNIFIDIALQASCTIPEVKYYNNLFLRCNKTNGGHALVFGSRYHATSYSGKAGTNWAHGCQVINNIFLDCGDERSNVGWYGINSGLTNVVADYNYVAKAGYAPVKEDPLRRAVGDPRGWSSFDWWEPHGVNGGDPGFVDALLMDFRLRRDSVLIDRGIDVGVSQDITGRPRPQGMRIDVGPYETEGEVPPDMGSRPSPPLRLRVMGE